MRLVKACQDQTRLVYTCQDLSRLVKTIWDHRRLYETMQEGALGFRLKYLIETFLTFGSRLIYLVWDLPCIRLLLEVWPKNPPAYNWPNLTWKRIWIWPKMATFGTICSDCWNDTWCPGLTWNYLSWPERPKFTPIVSLTGIPAEVNAKNMFTNLGIATASGCLAKLPLGSGDVSEDENSLRLSPNRDECK